MKLYSIFVLSVNWYLENIRNLFRKFKINSSWRDIIGRGGSSFLLDRLEFRDEFRKMEEANLFERNASTNMAFAKCLNADTNFHLSKGKSTFLVSSARLSTGNQNIFHILNLR